MYLFSINLNGVWHIKWRSHDDWLDERVSVQISIKGGKPLCSSYD